MRIQTGKVQSETGETETVQCFISLKEKSLKEIESEGAVINAKFDDIVLATVPVDKIEAISKKRCIKQIDIENPVMLLTDKARSQNPCRGCSDAFQCSNGSRTSTEIQWKRRRAGYH